MRGEGERLDDWGRFFNDYTLESLKALIAKLNESEFNELDVIDLWQETELLRGKDQAWVNGLVRKVDGSSKDDESSKADQKVNL